MDLVEGVNRVTVDWPERETYGLTDQVRQAAVSIPANIAEGQGRTGSKEFLHHLSIANGSLYEVATHPPDRAACPTPPRAGLGTPLHRQRVVALPFALYFAAAWVAGVALVRSGQRRVGWLLLTILATATLLAVVHVLVGVVAWLVRRGRRGRGLAYAALGYGTAASLLFWLTITVGGQRSPYP